MENLEDFGVFFNFSLTNGGQKLIMNKNSIKYY